MSFARNIVRDLIDKRLWPVALLMAVAIAAIPLLMGGGGSNAAGGDPGLPAAPDAASAASTVELLGPPSVRKRAGKVVDPFRRKKAVEADPSGAGSGESGGAGSSGAAAEKSPSSGSTGGTTAPGSGRSTTPSKPSYSVYRTTVRFSAGDTAKSRRIARLTPLGGLLDPAVMYLGVERDGKHALFLLGPHATSVGEGKCREATCRVIALASGDTRIVDLASGGAEPTQFELSLVSVKRQDQGSLGKALSERGKLHPDGRDVLRSMIEDGKTASAISGFGYDRVRGVMVQTGDDTSRDGS